MTKRLCLLLIAILIATLTSCGGGGTASNPIQDDPSVNPGNNVNPGTGTNKIIEGVMTSPSPFGGESNPLIAEVPYSINLTDYNAMLASFNAKINGTRAASFTLSHNRVAMEQTNEKKTVGIWEEMQTARDLTRGSVTFGNGTGTIRWTLNDSNTSAPVNILSEGWTGLLAAARNDSEILYTSGTPPVTINLSTAIPDAFHELWTNGVGKDYYDATVAADNAELTPNPATNADRFYMPDLFTNGYYANFMAVGPRAFQANQRAVRMAETITDEFSGDAYVDYLLDTVNRDPYHSYDMGIALMGMCLAGQHYWAKIAADQCWVRAGVGSDPPVGWSFDIDPGSISTLYAGLCMLDHFEGGLTGDAALLFNYCQSQVENTDSATSFVHQLFGFSGYSDNGIILDDLQNNAFFGWAGAFYLEFVDSDSSVYGHFIDKNLAWCEYVAPLTAGMDVSGDGISDDGWFLTNNMGMQYPAVIYPMISSEQLFASVEGAQRLYSFPF